MDATRYEARVYGPHVAKDEDGKPVTRFVEIDVLKLTVAFQFFLDMTMVCRRELCRLVGESADSCDSNLGYLSGTSKPRILLTFSSRSRCEVSLEATR